MAIGELDAVSTFVDLITSRRVYLQLQNDWSRMYIEHDALSYSRPENLTIARQQLTASGLYGLANALPTREDNFDYECAWRLCDWSILDEQAKGQQPDNLENLFEIYHYHALKSLQIKDEMGVQCAITNARHAIIDNLKNASLECTNNLYNNLKNLALIQQIEDFCQVNFLFLGIGVFFCKFFFFSKGSISKDNSNS